MILKMLLRLSVHHLSLSRNHRKDNICVCGEHAKDAVFKWPTDRQSRPVLAGEDGHMQLFAFCKQLKLSAKDGKHYLTDIIDKQALNALIAAIRSVDWSRIAKKDYLHAEAGPVDETKILNLIENALTDRINDREVFMKGIDYSYYYETEG